MAPEAWAEPRFCPASDSSSSERLVAPDAISPESSTSVGDRRERGVTGCAPKANLQNLWAPHCSWGCSFPRGFWGVTMTRL